MHVLHERLFLVLPSAELSGVIRLKEQVKRNIERFPEDFMFELSKSELKIGGRNLRPPIAINLG